jgi:hypothetical protein
MVLFSFTERRSPQKALGGTPQRKQRFGQIYFCFLLILLWRATLGKTGTLFFAISLKKLLFVFQTTPVFDCTFPVHTKTKIVDISF